MFACVSERTYKSEKYFEFVWGFNTFVLFQLTDTDSALVQSRKILKGMARR